MDVNNTNDSLQQQQAMVQSSIMQLSLPNDSIRFSLDEQFLASVFSSETSGHQFVIEDNNIALTETDQNIAAENPEPPAANVQKIYKSQSILEAILTREINSKEEIPLFILLRHCTTLVESFEVPAEPELSQRTISAEAEPNSSQEIQEAPQYEIIEEIEVESSDGTVSEEEAYEMGKALHKLRRYIKHENEAYWCTLCGYTNRQKYKVAKQHMIQHTGMKPFKCGSCHYKASLKFNLKKHMKIHEKHDMIFYCDKCRYRTKFKTKLEKHVLRHLKIKPYKCLACSKRYYYEGNLAKHMLFKHQISYGRGFT